MSGTFSARRTPIVLATNVAGEGSFLDAAMNSRFFKSLERSRLGVSQAWFHAALREGPVSAAGPNQQKFDSATADPIAHCRHLFTPAQFSKLRK